MNITNSEYSSPEDNNKVTLIILVSIMTLLVMAFYCGKDRIS